MTNSFYLLSYRPSSNFWTKFYIPRMKFVMLKKNKKKNNFACENDDQTNQISLPLGFTDDTQQDDKHKKSKWALMINTIPAQVL